MPTDEEVEAGASVMADLSTIDAPKLPAACWMGSVRAILEAAERVRSRPIQLHGIEARAEAERLRSEAHKFDIGFAKRQFEGR